jgi:hypothetical protein
VQNLKGASIGYAPGLIANIRLGWKRLARDKHSSLLRAFVNYGQKSFIILGKGFRYLSKKINW